MKKVLKTPAVFDDCGENMLCEIPVAMFNIKYTADESGPNEHKMEINAKKLYKAFNSPVKKKQIDI